MNNDENASWLAHEHAGSGVTPLTTCFKDTEAAWETRRDAVREVIVPFRLSNGLAARMRQSEEEFSSSSRLQSVTAVLNLKNIPTANLCTTDECSQYGRQNQDAYYCSHVRNTRPRARVRRYAPCKEGHTAKSVCAIHVE